MLRKLCTSVLRILFQFKLSEDTILGHSLTSIELEKLKSVLTEDN